MLLCMFLNFQTQEEVQAEVLESFTLLRRPATIEEVTAEVWSRTAIDGTRAGVTGAVTGAVRNMLKSGLLTAVRYEHNQHYFEPDILTRLALIPK